MLGILSIFVIHIVFMNAYPSPGTAQAQPKESRTAQQCTNLLSQMGLNFAFLFMMNLDLSLFYNEVSPVLQLLRNSDFPFHTSIFPLLDSLAK